MKSGETLLYSNGHKTDLQETDIQKHALQGLSGSNTHHLRKTVLHTHVHCTHFDVIRLVLSKEISSCQDASCNQ